ncbi:MAG: aspartate aminotransferase family protein, partial [Alphaproteobacteria bacterium]
PTRKARSSEEAALLEKAARYLPGASTGNMYYDAADAFVIKEGRGSKLYDYSGNEYIDYLMSVGTMLVGHANPRVVEAVAEALAGGSNFYIMNGAAVELAEEIAKAVPGAEKVRFMCSGAEATFYAMRIARAYRGRDKIVKFEGAYHGNNDYSMMSFDPNPPREFPLATRSTAGIPKVLEGEVLVCPFNDIPTTSAIIEKHHDQIAGVIVEPVQRIYPPKPGFLEGLREVTRHYGIPLIFDEIVTGFRWAYGGAQEYFGVRADLVALGKTLGGGYPIGAVCGREEIMRVLDPASKAEGSYVFQSMTLGGNRIAAVAGLATLRELRREGTYPRLFAMGAKLKSELARLVKDLNVPGVVCGDPPCFDVLFGLEEEPTDYRSSMKLDVKMTQRFKRHLLEAGVFKYDTKLYLSTAHSTEDLDRTIEAMAYALDRAL